MHRASLATGEWPVAWAARWKRAMARSQPAGHAHVGSSWRAGGSRDTFCRTMRRPGIAGHLGRRQAQGGQARLLRTCNRITIVWKTSLRCWALHPAARASRIWGQQSPATTPLTRRAQRAAHPSPGARSGRRRLYQRVHKHHACSGLGGAPFEGAGRDRPARQLPPLQAAARPRARQQWVHQQHPDDASSPAGEPVGGSAICYAPAPAGLPGPLVAPPAANSALWES